MDDEPRPEIGEAGQKEAKPAETSPSPIAPQPKPQESGMARVAGSRPQTLESRHPIYREAGGYTLRLDPPDLARLRELPGSRGKSDGELGEEFFDAYAARLTKAVSGDVQPPVELRVVVDPFSRQAFLAVGKTIQGIVSF